MNLELHTVSRDKVLYEAKALYSAGKVTVLAGSKINLNYGDHFKKRNSFSDIYNNSEMVTIDGFLKVDVEFDSLSSAASFVTGRTANGMIAWKTSDNRYVRYTLNGEV